MIKLSTPNEVRLVEKLILKTEVANEYIVEAVVLIWLDEEAETKFVFIFLVNVKVFGTVVVFETSFIFIVLTFVRLFIILVVL